MIANTKRCNRCGETIDRVSKFGHRLYCELCRKTRRTLTQVESQLKSGRRGNSHVKVAYCEQCGKPFKADRKKAFCSLQCSHDHRRSELESASQKRCTRCNEVKPVGEFYFKDATHHARMSRCKPCFVDVQLASQGKVRVFPYGQRVWHRKPARVCNNCGKRLGNKTVGQLCQDCIIAQLDGQYGGREWRVCLRAAVASASARNSNSRRSEWQRKMDTLVSSLKIRQRVTGECECKDRKKVRQFVTWRDRLAGLCSMPTRHVSSWHAAMDTKARNWRRKARKVTVYVEGNVGSITATSTASGIQMRFDWACDESE